MIVWGNKEGMSLRASLLLLLISQRELMQAMANWGFAREIKNSCQKN